MPTNEEDIKYVSQYGEDYVIDTIFNKKNSGVCIDIGASEGIRFNNSYLFDTLRNWKCICVEPHPTYYDLLCQNRGENTIKLNVAMTNNNAEDISFYTNDRGSLSTLNKDLEGLFRDAYTPYFNVDGFKEVKVKTMTLNSIIEAHLTEEERNNIDFISIDVEGSEPEVLQGLDLTIYRPTILIIELNDKEKVDQHLKQFGYFEVSQLGCNGFYSHDVANAPKWRAIIDGPMPKLHEVKHILD